MLIIHILYLYFLASSSGSDVFKSTTIPVYDITFDNVNQKTRVRHFKRDVSGKQLNMVQRFATLERIPSGHMSTVEPSKEEVLEIPLEAILPSANDEEHLKKELSVIVSRILVEQYSCLSDIGVQTNIDHDFLNESKKKSAIVSYCKVLDSKCI